jgi:predicted permease
MTLFKQLRFAARTLIRYPWTHGAAAFILAVALGGVLCMLSLVDEMLWSPTPSIEQAERVAWIYPARADGKGGRGDDSVPLANVLEYREQAQSFERVGWFTGAGHVLSGQGDPERVEGYAVGGDFYGTLGTTPRLGRLIEPADTLPEARPVVVLGEGYWRTRFGADPTLIGAELNLDGVLHTVVGICPERLFGRFGSPREIWVPHRPSAEAIAGRELRVAALMRLKDGVTFARADQELARLSLAIAEAHPQTDQGLSARAVPLPEVMTHFRPLAFALVLSALFVLGAAGANAANLLLAQTAERARELAIRQALGASRWALVWQWCLQVGVLMAIAVALGTLLGRWAIDLALASMPDHVRMSHYGLPEAQLSGRSWLVTVAIAFAATPLVSLVPARQAARIGISRALRDGGGGALGKARGGWLRRGLVGLQVALATALTFGAASAYRGYSQARDAPLGFEPTGVVQLQLVAHAGDAGERAEFLERVARGSASDGARPLLALTSDPPLTRWSKEQAFFVEGTARPPRVEMPWGKRNRVSPSYFELLGISLLEGRAFSDADRADAPCVAVFSQRLAQGTFGAAPALGRRVHLAAEAGDAARTDAEDITCAVVGVAADVHDVLQGSPGDLYLASAQWGDANTLLVRDADGAALSRLAGELRRFDPHQVIEQRSLSEIVEAASFGQRVLAALFIALALVGLVLACVGTYAVLAHSAGTRQREFGLRAVLGATPAQLAWLVAVENVPIGIGGMAVGLGTVGVGLVALAGYDPGAWAYPASLGIMLVVLAAATLLSARRVLRLEPGTALRRK